MFPSKLQTKLPGLGLLIKLCRENAVRFKIAKSKHLHLLNRPGSVDGKSEEFVKCVAGFQS